MTAIFLSHSSADNEAAKHMQTWLEQQGHTSLFLDFDPDAGIRPGSDWEETLYHKLRQCQAVIALLTPSWLASKWCFAELVQAREKGKAIFPVKVQACDASGVFGDIQHIDLTVHPEEGHRRLAIGLKERGLDPRDVFDWDPERPLYPGLEAFQEADAAIFFGRSEVILEGLETLDALRRQGRGAPRFALFLGASGSGKSSLLRAGIIPRLKKTPAEWLPVVPFRPQDDPLDELAAALADTFEAFERPYEWGAIRETLKAAAAREPADGKVLLNMARELCRAAKQREASVLLTIDQAEELFGYSAPDATTRFLRLLRAALEASNRQLMAAATLRSDFLAEFQTHGVLHDPAYDHDFLYQAVPVDPMPERNFFEIIQGPARLAGLRLEEGLVQAMVSDTGTRDALPLLAFTLRRLHEGFGANGELAIHEYEKIGRLDGAIRAEAERLLAQINPSSSDLESLRAAFVPTMVRINADGSFARRRAYADEMPPRAKAMLSRFVGARLLISSSDKNGRETLEVAHEALLRTWPQLGDWLAEDQDKLRLLEGLHRATEDWTKGSRSADLLVHRDGRLQDAVALISQRRFAVPEDSLAMRYLEACIEAQQAREAAVREEQERRVRDAERIAEEQKRAAAAQKNTARRTGIALVVALVLATFAFWQYKVATDAKNTAVEQKIVADEQRALAENNEQLAKKREIEADRQRRIADSRRLAALGESVLEREGPRLTALLTITAMQQAPTVEAYRVLTRALALLPAPERKLQLPLHLDAGEIRELIFNPDGTGLAAAIRAKDGGVALWDTTTGKSAWSIACVGGLDCVQPRRGLSDGCGRGCDAAGRTNSGDASVASDGPANGG